MNPFLAVLIGAVPLVLGLRSTAQWLLFRHRKTEPLDELFRLFTFKHSVDQNAFTKVVTLVGKCYRIAPGKLRPEDSFEGRLGKLDTWNLGFGAENLERRLEKELSVRLDPEIRVTTVQELLDYCGSELDANRSRVMTSDK
jgi:hypothetical protein